MWMAGCDVKGGQTIGTTDEIGMHAVEDRLHVHDLHATILYLTGATLPANYTFKASDNGVHTFTGLNAWYCTFVAFPLQGANSRSTRMVFQGRPS
jgi:hypothetical protein